MLKLADFFHLPQVDTLVEQFVADEPGLLIVAGLDPRPTAGPATDGLLPSGRSTLFRILMREILSAHPAARAVVVAQDRDVVRIPRELRSRIRLSLVRPSDIYSRQIADAARRRPGLLVIDRLCAETASAALTAARGGLRVLSQLDTVFKGGGVGRHLLDLGAEQEALAALSWVLAVQRLPALCPHCKRPASPDPAQLALLQRCCADIEGLSFLSDPAANKELTFFQAEGCSRCRFLGRQGDVAVFDVFRASGDASGLLGQSSVLPLEAYAFYLASLGQLALDDVFRLEVDQFHRTYNMLVSSERALGDANSALERKLAELEAANRVLQRRTEELISLHEIGQALITSADLVDLASRVCRRARELCGADRAILYYMRPTGQAEVLAVGGWDQTLVHQRLEAGAVFAVGGDSEPTVFARRPPGVPPLAADAEPLRAGLYVPLAAQSERVGLMIVHSTQRSDFTPGEVALLQTFANQAAVAIQRAGLIEELRAKIAQLEAAQVELAQKERMERELELARQVQQSVLPRTFPQVPGFSFGAQNEPARQVGGDFYDAVQLDEDHFGIVVADVSDKGMPAALYMALTRSLILAEARRERSPRVVLASVNRLLQELGEPNMFVTVFYGIVEQSTRRLTYARAGHDRPLLLRAGDVQELGGPGTALGILDGSDFCLADEQITLVPGDRLVLYTDGLIDVLAPDGQRLGRDRFIALLQPYAGLFADDLCAAVFADLIAYQGSAAQYDDMTMLVVAVE